MSQAHSRIGASSMHRWAACPGSVRLSEGMENRSSKYAEEGTLAHEVAANYLLKGKWPINVDPEMLEAVKVYTETVLKDLESSDSPLDEFLVEHRFNLESIHKGLFGTADAVIYHADQKVLRVFDYKHGAGIPVDVEGNEQLMYYGLGALLSTGHPCDTVELVIVQPRCDHADGVVRRWAFDSLNLLDFAADLAIFASRTENLNAPIVPGSHCRFCPASPKCPALKNKANELAKIEFAPALSYNPEELAKTLTWLPALEGWITSVREFAYREAEHGNPPPGWKLVQKRGSRKWTIGDEAELVEALRGEFKLPSDSFYDHSVKSPAQVEKLLSKSSKENLSKFTVTVSSGFTLAPETDKREAAKFDAKSEFAALT